MDHNRKPKEKLESRGCLRLLINQHCRRNKILSACVAEDDLCWSCVSERMTGNSMNRNRNQILSWISISMKKSLSPSPN